MHKVSSSIEIQNNLKKTVRVLAKDIGPRSYLQIESLEKTADYITSELRGYGYDVSIQSYRAEGRVYKNLIAEVKRIKTWGRVLLIGAHYDTVTVTPGADDNASGIAGLLELARLLRNHSFEKTVQFVAFALEEPPFFKTKLMGSYVYARSLKEKNITLDGMLCLEMTGYFSEERESQHFPLPFFKWFYPDKGNFIALVSNLQSKRFLLKVKDAFKRGTNLPLESISTFSIVPGVDFSDHWSFWKFDYPALMVTDTGFYRNPNYHSIGDTPETLNYEYMAEVVLGLKSVIEEIGKEHK